MSNKRKLPSDTKALARRISQDMLAEGTITRDEAALAARCGVPESDITKAIAWL